MRIVKSVNNFHGDTVQLNFKKNIYLRKSKLTYIIIWTELHTVKQIFVEKYFIRVSYLFEIQGFY